MIKKLKDILSSCNFERKYIKLYEENKELKNDILLNNQDFLEVFEEIGFKVKYYKKENFFEHKTNIEDFLFQLNIAFSKTKIEFILFIENKHLKFKDGGPFGLLAKKMNKKLKAFHKISYSNKTDLISNLKTGINIFNDVVKETLKQLNNG